MNRPVLGPRKRVRVEFSLAPDLAEKIYGYARQQELTLSQAGAQLIQAGWDHLAAVEGFDGGASNAGPRNEDRPRAS